MIIGAIVEGPQVGTVTTKIVAVTVVTPMILEGIKAVIGRIGGIKTTNQESIVDHPLMIAETVNTAASKLLVVLIYLVAPTPQIQTVMRKKGMRRTLGATSETTIEDETKNVQRMSIHISKRKLLPK
jgi:hypothetical protein